MSEHHWREHAPAFALGALDGEELHEFEAHLETCDECRAAVSEHAMTVESLGRHAPSVEPPADLRARVLEAAFAERPEVGSPAPAAPVSDIREARRVERTETRPGLGPWLAAAGFAFAIWAGLAWWRSTETADGLRGELDEARSRIVALESDRAARDSMLAALGGPLVETATLTSTGDQPQVRLFWNRDRDQLLVTAFDLPPAGPGRTYQLWGLAPGLDPVSLGTFDTGADGQAVALRDIPGGVAYAQSAVTDEPTGGSPQPTTQPFLVGPWSAAGQ